MIPRWLLSTLFVVSLITSNGCTLVSNLAMPFTFVRSPVTIDTKAFRGSINRPLTEEDACRLRLISDDILHNVSRVKAIENRWKVTKPCLRDSEEKEDALDRKDEIDDLDDLQKQKFIFLVAMSGGGSRAAALAAHTMSLLEKSFNRLQNELNVPIPAHLVSLVDAFSTVSGGSLYAYQVGRSKSFLDVAKESTKESTKDIPLISRTDMDQINCTDVYKNPSSDFELVKYLKSWERCFFFHLSRPSMVTNLGFYSSIWYLSPGNFFMGPITTIATDINYLDILSGGLTFTGRSVPFDLGEYFMKRVGEKGIALSPKDQARLSRIDGSSSLGVAVNPFSLKIGDLSPMPRIFFNTTALENGLPFVLTQRITHLFSDVSSLRTARLDTLMPHPKPLSHAYTLEEINSSPSTFSLAHAAMASAAFPFGLEPLEVAKYGYRDGYERLFRTQDRLHLTDGGVFDNSGLTTLSDLVLYLTRPAQTRNVPNSSSPIEKSKRTTVILVSINAEADDYDLGYPSRLAEPDSWYNTIWPFSMFSINFPLRIGALGFKALEVIHFTNKRRAEDIATREILHLEDLNKAGQGIRLLYFPINFAQLSDSDWNKIDDPDKLFSKIKEIPTSFGISKSDELVIEQTANRIISSRQRIGWPVGPKCSQSVSQGEYQEIHELGEAFAFALLRRSMDTWDNELLDQSKNNFVAKWCGAYSDPSRPLISTQTGH